MCSSAANSRMVGTVRRRVRLRASICDRTPVPRAMGTAVDRTLVTSPLLSHAQRGSRGRRDALDLDGSTCAVDSTVQLWSHIVIDVSKHSADYYPSQVLYPITQRGFDALAWNTPWFLVPNYFLLCAVVGGFGEHAGRSQRPTYGPPLLRRSALRGGQA